MPSEISLFVIQWEITRVKTKKAAFAALFVLER